MAEIGSSQMFRWHTFDISSELPWEWVDLITDVAKSQARHKELQPMSVTSREHDRNMRIPVLTLGGIGIKENLPWLDKMYRTLFLELGQSLVTEQLSVAEDQRYAINLNVQQGSQMRYECHVDSNPLEGLLYVTTHSPGSGGELVVSKRGDIFGVDKVEEAAARIYPVSGNLVFFDARHNSHYVTALQNEESMRIAVTMNFYTPSCSEADRPDDLNRHLGIE